MSPFDIELRGGDFAWNVIVGGKECWIGKSQRGFLLGRLFASEDEALAAGAGLDDRLAMMDERFVSEYWKALVFKLEREDVLVLWDKDNETADTAAVRYLPDDVALMQRVQERLSVLDDERTPIEGNSAR